MTRVVMIDGELRSEETAVVSVFDRGFLYGDSVFETIRTYEGRPFALSEHLRRLERSASLVAIDVPVSIDVVAREIGSAVDAARNPESYIRVMITRGSGELGLDPGLARDPRRIVIVAPLKPPPERAYRDGIATVTYRTQRTAEATQAVGAKVGNYLVSALAMREARGRGAEEALVVDGHDCIVEGATSNVFAVTNGRLVTPAEEAGILPGITRALILEVADRRAMPVELRALRIDELSTVDELFVSSSIRELLPIVKVDDQQIGDGRPGEITRALHAGFREKISEIHGLRG